MMFTHIERAPKWHPLPKLFPLSTQNLVQGQMATLQGIFNAAANANNFPEFVRNFTTMLVDRLGNGDSALHRDQASELRNAVQQVTQEYERAEPQIISAIKLPPPNASFPTVNLGDSDYIRTQVNPFINGLIRDSVEISQILMAAVDYHMWDACAHTFLLSEPGKE